MGLVTHPMQNLIYINFYLINKQISFFPFG